MSSLEVNLFALPRKHQHWEMIYDKICLKYNLKSTSVMINISPGVFDVLFGDIFTDNSADSKVILVPLRIWWIEFETHDRAHDHKIDSCSYVLDFAKCIVLTCAVAVFRNGYQSKISYFGVGFLTFSSLFQVHS